MPVIGNAKPEPKLVSDEHDHLLDEVTHSQSPFSHFQHSVEDNVKHVWSKVSGALGGIGGFGFGLFSKLGPLGIHLKYEALDLLNDICHTPPATYRAIRTGGILVPFRNLLTFHRFNFSLKKEFYKDLNVIIKKARRDFNGSWSPETKVYFGFITVLSAFTLYHLKIRPWPKHNAKKELDCLHRTVVITGSSSGIGYRLAYEFLKRGAFVILSSPDMVKARKARLDLSRKLMRYVDKQKRRFMDQAQVRYYEQIELPYHLDIDYLVQNMAEVELNLASTASIYSFCRKVQGMAPDGIDILINNAAVKAPPEEMVVTDEGKEIHFSVNYFGHFVLTNLLLGLLAKRKGSRIINVTCKNAVETGFIKMSEFIGPYLEEDGLPFLPAQDGYANSKLAMYLFNCQLAKELILSNIHNVTTYSVCPGATRTFLDRRITFSSTFSKLSHYFRSLFYKKPLHAAQTILYCALSRNCKIESGFFYENNRRSLVQARQGNPDQVAHTLWHASMRLMSVGHMSMLKLTEQMHVISHENIYQLAKDLFLHRRDVMTHLLLTEEAQAFETRHRIYRDKNFKDARENFTYFWKGFYLCGGENSGLIERWVLYNTHPGFRALQQEYDVWFECTGSAHFHPESSGKMAALQYMPTMAAPVTREDIEELEHVYASDSDPDEDIEFNDRYYPDFISLEEFI